MTTDPASNSQLMLPMQETGCAGLQDRFEMARGRADIKWRSDELMAMLRGEDGCPDDCQIQEKESLR